MRNLFRAAALAAVSLIVIGARPALAHKLGAECKLNGGRVELEAFYDDDTPARNARVAVIDEGKNNIAEGRTDDKGVWSFEAPKPGTYQVTVDAGAGHRTRVKFTVPAEKSAAPPPGSGSPGTASPTGEKPPAQQAPGPQTISEGPTRAETTRFPLARVGLGLGIIAALGLVLWFVLHRGRASGDGPPISNESGSTGGVV
jgi:nickel transport protein